MGAKGQLQRERTGDAAVLVEVAVAVESGREPWLARLFRRGWQWYLEGWVALVRDGYAPPGVLPGNRWGPAPAGPGGGGEEVGRGPRGNPPRAASGKGGRAPVRRRRTVRA